MCTFDFNIFIRQRYYVQIWFRANYRWHLKHSRVYKAFSQIIWHPIDPLQLAVMEHGSRVALFLTFAGSAIEFIEVFLTPTSDLCGHGVGCNLVVDGG